MAVPRAAAFNCALAGTALHQESFMLNLHGWSV